jgi:hypothetical protein
MDADIELDTWRRNWQSASAVPANLTQRVERETRMMWRVVVAEIVVAVVCGGGSITWAALSHRRETLWLVVGIWAFIAIAWTISSLLCRGAWTPVTATTMAFLELSILRCQRRREAVVAQGVLYVMILSFDLTRIYFQTTQQSSLDVATFLTTGHVVWVWMITAALAVVAVRQQQRLGQELENLSNLQLQLECGPIQEQGEVSSWHSPKTSVKRSGKKRLRDRWSAKS